MYSLPNGKLNQLTKQLIKVWDTSNRENMQWVANIKPVSTAIFQTLLSLCVHSVFLPLVPLPGPGMKKRKREWNRLPCDQLAWTTTMRRARERKNPLSQPMDLHLMRENMDNGGWKLHCLPVTQYIRRCYSNDYISQVKEDSCRFTRRQILIHDSFNLHLNNSHSKIAYLSHPCNHTLGKRKKRKRERERKFTCA